MKIYIAGKITGLPNEEVMQKFGDAKRMLYEVGYKVMSPSVQLFNPGFKHEEYMHICYAMIDICDAVYMLSDWEDSKGARMERKYAEEQKKLILYEEQMKNEQD